MKSISELLATDLSALFRLPASRDGGGMMLTVGAVSLLRNMLSATLFAEAVHIRVTPNDVLDINAFSALLDRIEARKDRYPMALTAVKAARESLLAMPGYVAGRAKQSKDVAALYGLYVSEARGLAMAAGRRPQEPGFLQRLLGSGRPEQRGQVTT